MAKENEQQNNNDDEQDFDVIEKASENLTLVEERLAWQKKHAKPWYLSIQKPKKKYPKNKEQDND